MVGRVESGKNNINSMAGKVAKMEGGKQDTLKANEGDRVFRNLMYILEKRFNLN